MPEDHFGENVAERYDETIGVWGREEAIEPAVAFLAALARGRSALELGIGTGRIALPLAARGVPVQGIDLSEAMVARLRSKPGGSRIPVAIGDFATTRVEGTFGLAYLVFNTILNLTTQEAQAACFENVAAHLERGGCFVVETELPALRRLPVGERHVVAETSPEHTCIDEYDVASQGLVSHHFWPAEGRSLSVPFRYVWPSELDLMARMAGLHARERWSGWQGEPFTSESTKLVGVWEKAVSE
jgi:SAM-dependent methyltransferase